MRRLRKFKFLFSCVFITACYLFSNEWNESTKIKKLETACDLLSKGQPLDTSRIVNPHPYINTIVPRTDCDDVTGVYLFVYVHTSIANYQRRSVIRRTWGNVSMYEVPVRIVFVVGDLADKSNTNETILLRDEVKNHGDILQSNFLDTYHNLSIKAVAGLKWVTQHCRSAKYVLKTDDDVFVNMYLLLSLLEKEDRKAYYGNTFLLCNVFNGEVKLTIINYPSYCQGIAFVMSMDVSIVLHNASLYVPMLWIDDVYITGFLPALLPEGTINTVSANSFYLATRDLQNSSREVLIGPDFFRFIFYPEDDLKVYDVAWERLINVSERDEFKEYVREMHSLKMWLKRIRLKMRKWKLLLYIFTILDIITNIL